MDFALINATPFVMAALLAIPLFNRLLNKTIRAWLSAGVMLVLFFALVSYFPQLQSLDQTYKEQHGIVLDEYHGDEESHVTDLAGDEAGTQQDEPDVEIITVNAITRDLVWVPELGLSMSFYLDGLSLLFGLIVTGIGAGIFLYAGYYFDEEAEQSRFITILFAFAGAMLGLVLSGNLITLFIMWELTSITSFLLIGFKGAKSEDARFGASQAFMITGIGGLALIAGFVLLATMSGNVLGADGMVFDIARILQANPADIADHKLYLAALILLALGAFTKSAQFPFHFWLPGAMAAPTPASAYLHSATMVKAGIYLLLRLYPAMHANPLWTTLLVWVGISTMLMAAVIALFQRDLKGLLAYSTVSWLGALVGMIGLPDSMGIKAALIGIIAHALYKAALFLSAGTIDHNTGTRIIDKLGGLRKQMPVIAGVVIISALSMAGLPIFFGFVAKEVLLDAWAEAQYFTGQNITYYMILVSAALTGTAGFIFIWDVFFKAPTEEIHFHTSPKPLLIAPVALVLGTTLFGLMLDPPITLIEDIVKVGVPKAVSLHLLPDSLTNPLFLTSLTVVASGFLVFLLRRFWLPIMQSLPLPRATNIYQLIIRSIDWIGDKVLNAQNGQVRYYLATILGSVAAILITRGIVGDLFAGQDIQLTIDGINVAALLRIILMILSVIAAFITIIAKKHITAALSLGVLGYAVGGLILVEPSPDVALVQFLVETLGTILIIVMIGRISDNQRLDVMNKLWKGRSMVGDFNVGILRDIAIAGAVGVAVFIFSLTALVNRPERNSIATYHLNNTYEEIGIEDVVGAIVADYRGMDTIIEVMVFATAAMGVLTLLVRGYSNTGRESILPAPANVKAMHEFSEQAIEDVKDTTNLSTPFTRLVARIVLPLSLLIGLSHIINGSHAPGDGFTAGAISGLATSLWFVIFGYNEAKERLTLYSPYRLMRVGMLIVFVNAMLPVVFNLHGGAFLAHVDYGKMIGINEILHRFGLELTSGIFFEIGIALAVFGGFGAIMEAIAHPKESPDLQSLTMEMEVIDEESGV